MIQIALALLVAAAPSPTPAAVTTLDTAAASHFFARAHELCTAEGGRLWGVSLCGPMMLVDAKTREAIGNEPVDGAVAEHGIYRFSIPEGVGIADTTTEFHGRLWAMFLWPQDPQFGSLDVSMMHESFHRIQPQLHLEGGDDLGTNQHLDTQDARIWLRGEFAALQTALQSQGDARKNAVADAVAMARYRWSLFPKAQQQEAILDIKEGLAESTGIDAGLAPAERIPYALTDIKLALNAPSFIRGFPYGIGPAYGELMDAQDPQWRARVENTSSLALLCADVYGLHVATPTQGQARAIIANYGGPQIIAEEQARAQRIAQDQIRYAKEFNGPVIALPLHKFSIVFSPLGVEGFGDRGSVYHTLTLSDAWGKLQVDGGDALIDSDFKALYVPRGATPLSGAGWMLQLAPHVELQSAPNRPPGSLAPAPKQTP